MSHFCTLIIDKLSALRKWPIEAIIREVPKWVTLIQSRKQRNETTVERE